MAEGASRVSVLLIGLDEDRGPALIRRLRDEGDVVGVIEESLPAGDVWRAAGAHVAMGSPRDADLVERASQHARSVVVLEEGSEPSQAILDAVLEAGRVTAPEPPRIIYVSISRRQEVDEKLEASAFDYVILRSPRRGRLKRKAFAVVPGDLAEAVNAADDLPGNPRLDVDLTTPEGWSALGLDPREARGR